MALVVLRVQDIFNPSLFRSNSKVEMEAPCVRRASSFQVRHTIHVLRSFINEYPREVQIIIISTRLHTGSKQPGTAAPRRRDLRLAFFRGVDMIDLLYIRTKRIVACCSSMLVNKLSIPCNNGGEAESSVDCSNIGLINVGLELHHALVRGGRAFIHPVGKSSKVEGSNCSNDQDNLGERCLFFCLH